MLDRGSGTIIGVPRMARDSRRPFWMSRWPAIAAWWLLQSLLIYFIGAVWAESANQVDPAKNPVGLFGLDDLGRMLLNRDCIVWCVVVSVLTALAQAVFLWPVRKPGAKQARGWSLRVSLGVAGLAMTGLAAGLFFTVTYSIHLFYLEPRQQSWSDIIPGSNRWGAWYLAVACVVSWCVFTPLLVAFCKQGPRESLLARLSARLFLGTMIEIVAIIPLDVMARRRDSCYCLAGTYFALGICGAIAIFFIGPALLLPLLAKRRRRWYFNKCDVCAYDMSGCLSAAQCPECGSGWRASESS